jgi:hypothetical protein
MMVLALFDTILIAGGPESAGPRREGEPEASAGEEIPDINDADFNDADFNDADFNDTDFNDTDFNDTDFNDTDFNDNGTSKTLQREARRKLEAMEQRIKTSPDIPDSLRKSLTRIIETARSETDRYDKVLANARIATEQWFDDAMDRVSGWYKRQTQLIVLGLALVVCFGSNADTFVIANTLFKDDAVRQALVAQAVAQAQEGSDSRAPTGGAGAGLIGARDGNESAGPGIPLGWTVGDFPDTFPGWVVKFFGLFLTSVAVALGAPFWFDLLNKLVSLRGAGGSPAKSASPSAVGTSSQ